MKKLLFLVLAVFALCLCVGCGGEQKQKKAEPVTLRLAAAASLEKVFVQKLIPSFEAKHPGVKLEGTYDASGKLQKQIEQGLKADVFISAATKQMLALSNKDYMDKASVKPLLENKLVLIVPAQGESSIKGFKDFAQAKHPAVGDPNSVPAGQYAQEALINLGLWQQVEKQLSLGSNVVQVLNWVAEGSADAGMVYASDAATNKKVKIVAEAPAGSLKKKVIYPIGILQKSEQPKLAKELVEFLGSEEAAKAFQEYGFAVAK